MSFKWKRSAAIIKANAFVKYEVLDVKILHLVAKSKSS